MTDKKNNDLKNYTAIIYALQGLNVFFGITIFAAIIMNYIKKAEVKETWLASHFDWQIKTFWYSVVVWGVLLLLGFGSFIFSMFFMESDSTAGFSSVFLGTGAMMLIGGVWFIWYLYRVIKGAVRLFDEKPL